MPPSRDPLLTVPEVAELLNTSERYVRRLIEERRIEFIRIGRKVRITGSVVDALIDCGRVPVTVRPGRAA
jgi:excisionase family DNA binding protein